MKTKLKLISTCLSVVLVISQGCNSNESNSKPVASADSSKSKSADEIIPPKNHDGFSGAIGNVVKYSGNEVEISTSDKPLTIKLTDSLHLYAPSPSSLANIKSSEYIGVVSKKQ